MTLPPRIHAAHGQLQIWLTCDVTVNIWNSPSGRQRNVEVHAVLYMYLKALIKITKVIKEWLYFRSVLHLSGDRLFYSFSLLPFYTGLVKMPSHMNADFA